MEKKALESLVKNLGERYPEVLKINLASEDDKEIFKWFLASILFGAPIRESSAIKTYKCFKKYGILTPQKIIQTGWQGLVDILDEGTYTRYDFRTSDKLLEVMGNLNTKYGGSLNKLHEDAAGSLDLEKRLKELGKGIGNITVSIFLRDLRGIWHKADPKPTPLVILAARRLEIIETENPEQASRELKAFWTQNKIAGESFVNFETALLRYGKDLRRKGRRQMRK